jgi:serine/threonine protein kinase
VSPSPEWSEGQLLNDEFVVKARLGRGGMGVVHLVERRGAGHRFAVKTIPMEALHDDESRRIFARELQNLIDLPKHPHLTAYRFFRTIEGRYALFMELAENGSLEQWIRENRLSTPEQMLDVAIQVAWGLHAVHMLGLVHQDVKPANILMCEAGLAKISDFGLARTFTAANRKVNATDATGEKATAPYRSPEQANGRSVTHASDIWSWGLTVFAMFTGEATWNAGEIAPEMFEHYLETTVERLDRPAMPLGLGEVLRRCFAVDPKDRWPSMTDVAENVIHIYERTNARPYNRKAPSAAAPRLAAIMQDRMTMSGVQWDSPQKWLAKALHAEGRQVVEIEGLVSASDGSRRAQAVADLAQYDDARRRFEQLVAGGRKDLEPDLGELYRHMSLAHEGAGDLPGASSLLDCAITILEGQHRMRGTNSLVCDLAITYLRKGFVLSELTKAVAAAEYYDRAIETYNDAFDLDQKDEHADILGKALMNRAVSRAMGSNYRAALLDFDQGIMSYTNLVERKGREELRLDLARALVNKANVTGNLGRNLEACSLYGDAIKIYERGNIPETFRGMAVALGDSIIHELHAPKAALFDVCKFELAIAHVNKAATHETLGEFHIARDNSMRAIQIFEDMLQQEGRIEVAPHLARGFTVNANATRMLGDPRAAMRVHDRAIELFKNVVERQGRWELSNALGVAYIAKADTAMSLGEIALADIFADYAVDLYANLVQQEGRTELYHEMATAYLSKASVLHQTGHHEDAVRMFDHAIGIYIDLVENKGRSELAGYFANVLKTKAITVRAMGDNAGAVTLYDRSIELYEELVGRDQRCELSLQLSTAYVNKANVLDAVGNAKGAIALYDKGIAIRERLVFSYGRTEVTPRLAMAYLNKSCGLSSLGEHKEALLLCQRAVQIYQRLISEGGRDDLEVDLARANMNCCLLLLPLGDRSRAIRDARVPLAFLRAECERTNRSDIRAFVDHAEKRFASAAPSAAETRQRIESSRLRVFRCMNPACVFQAHVSGTQTGVDVMRCPLCSEMAIALDTARPVFRCTKCRDVFWLSGSANAAEQCSKCGATARRSEKA